MGFIYYRWINFGIHITTMLQAVSPYFGTLSLYMFILLGQVKLRCTCSDGNTYVLQGDVYIIHFGSSWVKLRCTLLRQAYSGTFSLRLQMINTRSGFPIAFLGKFATDCSCICTQICKHAHYKWICFHCNITFLFVLDKRIMAKKWDCSRQLTSIVESKDMTVDWQHVMLREHFCKFQTMQLDSDGFTCIGCKMIGQKMYNPMKNNL